MDSVPESSPQRNRERKVSETALHGATFIARTDACARIKRILGVACKFPLEYDQFVHGTFCFCPASYIGPVDTLRFRDEDSLPQRLLIIPVEVRGETIFYAIGRRQQAQTAGFRVTDCDVFRPARPPLSAVLPEIR